MSRLSRLAAVFALMPFLVRGLVSQCGVGDKGMTERAAHSAPVAHAIHGEHQDQSCDTGERGGCGVTHNAACTAMSSCATALPAIPIARGSDPLPPALLLASARVALVGPSQAPEPPPPRG